MPKRGDELVGCLAPGVDHHLETLERFRCFIRELCGSDDIAGAFSHTHGLEHQRFQLGVDLIDQRPRLLYGVLDSGNILLSQAGAMGGWPCVCGGASRALGWCHEGEDAL